MLTTLAAIAPAFNVEAALRAYLNTLQGAARARSDAYFEGGYWIILWSTLVAVVSYLVMLRMGWSAKWRDLAERITRRPFLQAMLYAVPFVLIGALLTAAWEIYASFVREQQYGLMNQSFGGWLGEQAIVIGVNTLIMAVLVAIVFALIRWSPRQADAFGLDAAREPDGFAETTMQLSEYRKIEPGPIEEALFFDHPSGSNRVHRSMAWKAAHLGELPEAQRGMLRPLPPSASSMPASARIAPAPASNVQR